jgi:hypothetical protein
LVPLLVAEPQSAALRALLEEDPAQVIWWGTPLECVSAIARLERESHLSPVGVRDALKRLDAAEARWIEAPPTPVVREQARRLLRVHRLRTADALQVAAAIVASDFQPGRLEFVTLDSRQAEAADREGFPILG